MRAALSKLSDRISGDRQDNGERRGEQAGATLTRQDVVRAYVQLLGRMPENEEVIAFHIGHYADVQALTDGITGSDEYHDRMASLSDKGDVRFFTIDDIPAVADAFSRGDRDAFAGAYLKLPEWFDRTIEAGTDAYREQMLRLWSAITARGVYTPIRDEDTPEVADDDFIYRPAFYGTGDSGIAGGHLMAMGHIMLRSELPAGGRVLEYGAGFGQNAVAFARTGARVHTVDINAAFCKGVRRAGRHFKVDLKAFRGGFGFNPSYQPNHYDLVLFYESFHHCLDHDDLIAALPGLLAPGGKVILAGEPVFARATPDMPYPWGFRLDWENIAIMRLRGWMELGFQETYLLALFVKAGFDCAFFGDPNSHWAQVYRFTLAPTG